MKANVNKITKTILDIMFVVGSIITVTLPFILKPYGRYIEPNISKYFWQNVIILAICGVFSLMIVWELRKIFKTVLADDCFVRINVTSLNRMGIYSFVIAAAMCIKCVYFYMTLAGLSMVIVFIIAGLFSKVLAQVFDRAVTYKLENDLTI